MKTFLLGTGCMKGGTTWLFQYLKQSPQYVAGFRKEYHVFDALDVPSMAYRKEKAIRDAEEAIVRARDGGAVNAQVMMLAAMQANPTYYYDYFAALLMTRPQGRVTADVTPSYAMLPAARLAEIKDAFAERGVRTVALFLMRDPVDRILSHVRMLVRERPERFGGRTVPEVLADRYAHPENEQRTTYHHTIARLDEVFGPDEVHFGFYEDLFTEERVREITEVLGIDFHPPELGRRHNASPPAEVPDATQQRIAGHYREVYDAVAARFPAVDLPALWPSMRHLG